MIFWIAALVLLSAAGLVLAWPLLGRGSNWKAAGLGVLLLLPLGGALLYRDVGTPAAINAVPLDTNSADFDTLADDLKSRLSEREEDLEGWLLLGRSLKSLQRYDEALDALTTAQRIAPDNPVVQVDLAEARLFASGNPKISDEVRAMLQTAVTQAPGLQKGLWLLGIDAAQRNQDEEAIAYWQRLLIQLDPASPVAQSVEEQITLARGRLGIPPGGTADSEGDWVGVGVTVDLDPAAREALPTPLPPNAALFVIVRPAGTTAGPPLGVARVEQPAFPLGIQIDDRNAMLPQRKLSAQPRLSFKARLSLSGEPTAGSGDWESAATEIEAVDSGTLTLSLESRVE